MKMNGKKQFELDLQHTRVLSLRKELHVPSDPLIISTYEERLKKELYEGIYRALIEALGNGHEYYVKYGPPEMKELPSQEGWINRSLELRVYIGGLTRVKEKREDIVQ